MINLMKTHTGLLLGATFGLVSIYITRGFLESECFQCSIFGDCYSIKAMCETTYSTVSGLIMFPVLISSAFLSIISEPVDLFVKMFGMSNSAEYFFFVSLFILPIYAIAGHYLQKLAQKLKG